MTPVSPAASHVRREQPLPAELIAHQTRTTIAKPDERAHQKKVATEGRATATSGPFDVARPSRSPLTGYESHRGTSKGVHAAIRNRRGRTGTEQNRTGHSSRNQQKRNGKTTYIQKQDQHTVACAAPSSSASSFSVIFLPVLPQGPAPAAKAPRVPRRVQPP